MSKAFGEQNPNQGETAVSWQTWSDGSGSVPTITGDSDWGKLTLTLSPGEEGRSAVYDLGSATTRRFTLTENRYGSGSGLATLQIRGDTSSFLQDDATPDWETYLSPISRGWRYVQIREITGNTLSVSATNPRYFEDGDGNIVVLIGSHTWGNGQDWSGYAFDWDTYLDNLVAWGHNFTRYWTWESPTPNGIPVPAATGPMTPLPWNRTGPGNAADGGLKFDLTSFNSAFFNRVRSRCIDAWNRGIYVSIMLFNGFSVAGKGSGLTPFAYHPMQNGNNINSIDGDPNNDGEGYETENGSIAAVTTAQQAYVAHLIDTVNDLDNVLFEICNEADGGVSGSTTWETDMIDYIHTYEASKPKQHPVWFTVLWPSGDNNDLLTSNAEVIAPNSGLDYDGTKVVIVDTDHFYGIGGDADWAWSEFTNGAGGVAYMDSYDNLFIDGSGSGHPLQNLRDNLGYILTLANMADLLHMVPQVGGGSPCQTGYCLYGNHYYICYQPDSGDFTLDMSGDSGSFNIRKVRLSNGDVDTSQTTTGGATRTITQPTGWTTGWACIVYQ